MYDTIDYTVGQQLWFESNNDYSQRPPTYYQVTVTKVGRKWVELNEGQYKVERDKVHVDGGRYSSPGRLWLTKEDAESYLKLKAAWSDIVRRLSAVSVPKGLTPEKLDQVCEILDIKRPQ